MSIEIITTTLVGGTAFAYMLMVHFGLLKPLQKLVLASAMALSLALLWTIANVCTLATVPT